MPVSFKVWIGLIVIGLGVGGLVYSLAQFSNAVASKGPVFSEADVPHIPDSVIMTYIPIEVASAMSIAVGIAIAALGHADTFADKGTHIISSRGEVRKMGKSTKVADSA